MLYKDYGLTGARVSAVGFGGMRFDLSRSDYENSRLLRYAHDRGVTYFDTAPGYCEDHSEDIYGHALKELPRDSFFVSTKRMPREDDTIASVTADVEKSIKRLNTGYIDFFHAWCFRQMAQYELAMRPGGLYEALLRCQERGLIRNIVFSSHQSGDEIAQVVQTGKFRGVLLGANILNFPYRWSGVEAAYQAGLGVVAMNPLAGGEIAKHEKELAFLSLDGLSPTQSALRFLICCPQITVTLVGFTTTEHIDEACRIAADGRAFSAEEIERIRGGIGEKMNRLCTGCGYCTGCPADINVAGHMQVHNEHSLFGKNDEEMKKQLGHEYNWGRLVGRAGEYAACVACGKCESACTQKLPIIDRLKDFARWQP